MTPSLAGIAERARLLRDRLFPGGEADRATTYWADLTDYHETNDRDPIGLERSRWIAEELVPAYDVSSLLEVGTNSGRNLAIVRATHPSVRVKGIDVAPAALDYARRAHPEVEFELQDANEWSEAPDSWDGILTMSVLDHIPDTTIDELARNMLATARKCVICVELWDGGEGTRGPYKYSRNTRDLFERHGAETLRWEESPGQYDTEGSLLWLYIGRPGRRAA